MDRREGGCNKIGSQCQIGLHYKTERGVGGWRQQIARPVDKTQPFPGCAVTVLMELI